MRNYLFTLTFALSFIILSCGGGGDNIVHITDTNFSEEVPLRFNFEFQFDKTLVHDSMVNVLLDEQVLHFEPPIEGSFSWSQNDVLQFNPSSPLKPATNYKVSVANEYKQYIQEVVMDDQWSLNFHTPLLYVEEVHGYWGANKNNANLAAMFVAVKFNHQISPEDLMGKLKVSVGGQEQTYVVEQSEAALEVNLYLPQVKVEDKQYEIDLYVSKDLRPLNGTEGIPEDIQEKTFLKSPFVMEIKGLKGEFDGAEGTLRIFTSQKIEESEFKKHFSIDPKVKYTLTMEEEEVRVVSEEFDSEKTYHVKFTEGMKGVFGGSLKQEYEGDVAFGKLNPSISFLDEKNIYLSKNGNKNIEVNIINVDEVKMTIYKVYENNIIQFFNERGYYDDYYYYEEDWGYSGDKNEVGQMGDIVWEETINTADLKKKGVNKILDMNFKDKIKNADGLYQIVMTASDNYWLTTKKIVSISDIGLIVKKGPRSISVFANSIHEAKPMTGVEITLIGKNNQLTQNKKTDANGVVVFEVDEDQAINFETALVTARLADDYNYMLLEKTRVSTSRFDVGGYWENNSGLMTFIYPERDIYRPGEKINISAILRNYKWETPNAFPVRFKLTSPTGKEVGNVRKKLNEEGSVEASFQTSASSSTGSYMVTLLTANDVVLQNIYIKVEEFVPDRIKVDATLSSKEFVNGDDVGMTIEAKNLFGTPAANRNWESEMQISRSYFSSPDFPNYNFSINQNYTYFNSIMLSGETDENGEAYAAFEIPEEYANMGMLYARMFTTVFDETGRPVNRNNSAKIHTQDYYYGIGYDGYYFKTNSPVTTKLVAVGKDKKVASGVQAELTLIRHEYKSVLTQSGSYYRYRSVPKEVILDKKTITLDGKENSYTFTPDLTGRYELRISKPGVANHVSKTYYCYGWGSTSSSSFKVDNEGNIDIKLDKEEYLVGETAKVLMSAPFSGRVLVTVESDKVVKHFYKDTDKKTLAFDLKITEEMLPNVYVSATLFRPHAVTDLPLTVAHGYAPLIVKDKSRELEVKIESVEKSRSKEKQTIKVKAAPNSKVTLAVVDEGILQVTGFKTPDPYSYFYQKRGLGVSSHDIYPYLFPEVSLHSGRPGGGADAEMAKRLNPMKNKRFKLVSYWSGIIETNAKGEAEYEIDIPQFSGSLRIMAVNYKGKSFGSAEKNMIVADPIVLSAGIPRFLSPGDTLVMPLTITNTTEKSASADVKIELEGPLTLVPFEGDDLPISANSEGRKVVRIAVDNEIGEAKIIAKVTAFGETFIHETDISVRPGSPLQKRSGAGAIPANKTQILPMDDSGFMEKTIGRKLIVGKSPMIKFTKDIEYLVGYPHGCVEQTVSRAFPQLYFEDIIKELGVYSENIKSARHNVQQAIVRLQSMQLYNGGYSYWPGHGNETYWGSVLATHFLVEADRAGYDVNDKDLQMSLDYLKMRVKEKSKYDYYYNGNQRRTIFSRSSIYSAYVLALANQADKSSMNFFKANAKDLSLDSKYLLAGAYQLIGDQNSFRAIVPNAFEGERAVQQFGGSFSSYIRDEAMSLNVLLDTDPDNAQVPYLAKHVSEQLSSARYLNTQERLFGFLAMGKFSRKNADNDVTAVIKNGGKTIADFKGRTLHLETKDLGKGELEVVTSGKGNLYYFWETEGIDASGSYKEEDSFLSIRKTFYDRSGNRITNGRFSQNDLIIVKLSIVGLTNKYVENVAISDVLPAGFEIENPRLDDLPQYRWMGNRSYPEYQDIRDDRINMYTSVSKYNNNFYYMVRAVSPGKYYMGPVGADAMYDGEYHSYSGAQWITISE